MLGIGPIQIITVSSCWVLDPSTLTPEYYKNACQCELDAITPNTCQVDRESASAKYNNVTGNVARKATNPLFHATTMNVTATIATNNLHASTPRPALPAPLPGKSFATLAVAPSWPIRQLAVPQL